MPTLMILHKEYFFYLLLSLGVAWQFNHFKGLVIALRMMIIQFLSWQMSVKIDT